MAQNTSAKQAKRNIFILFGIVIIIIVIIIIRDKTSAKINNESALNKPTATTRSIKEPINDVSYGTLICDECKEIGMKINVWTHPDRSGVAFSVSSGTQVKITDSQIYEDIKYYKVKYGSKTGWIRDIFVQKNN